MRILIVGGSSALATSLIPVLKESAQVITAGRSHSDVHMDLNNLDPIQLPRGLNVVVHCAAKFGSKTPQEAEDILMTNVMGTAKLCQASAMAGINHFIYISSIYATLTAGSAYYSMYALSKRQAEEVSSFVCNMNGIPLTILRPSPLYGESKKFIKHQPLIYNIIDQAQRGVDITLYGKNDALRNYLHADDFSKIIQHVISKKIIGTFNCLNSHDISISRMAQAAINAFESKSKIVFDENKNDIVDNVFPKDDSLFKQINFYPGISMEDGMKMIAKSKLKK